MKIAPGQHVVSFGNVYGYATPAPQPVTTASGVTTALQGSYVAYGSLRITTSPAVAATISIDNVPRDDWGMWQSMPAGTYAISFGKVAGFDPPASQTITLASGQSLTVTGTYTPDSAATGPDPSTYGLLPVTTSPARSYGVSFGPVPGYTTPAPQTAMVTAGALSTITGTYSIGASSPKVNGALVRSLAESPVDLTAGWLLLGDVFSFEPPNLPQVSKT